MKRSVLIATPVGNDLRVVALYALSLVGWTRALSAAGIESEVHLALSVSLLVEARNKILDQFMNSRHTDLMLIDSDISGPDDAVLRLVQHPVPFVAVPYRRKSSRGPDFLVNFSGKPERDKDNGLFAADTVGAGFMRLRRQAITTMMKAYPDLTYTQNGRSCVGLFDTRILNNGFQGEDYVFCERWRAIGETLWLDLDIPLRHWGMGSFGGTVPLT